MSVATVLDEITAILKPFSRAVYFRDGGEARLGIERDGAWTLGTGLALPECWITRGEGEARSEVRAFLLGVSSAVPGLEVLAKQIPGGSWIVTDINYATAPYQMPQLAAALNKPDSVPEIDTTSVESFRLMPGQVRRSEVGGLYVWAEELEHEAGTLEGQDIELMPPSTTDERAIVLISLDPDTNTLQQTLSDAIPSNFVVSRETLIAARQYAAAITTPPGHIRLGAVPLTEGDTEVDWAQIFDVRELFSPSNPPAVVQTLDNTTTTLASIVVAEASAVRITGEAAGAKSDYSAAAGRGFAVTARRATGGNVTIVGSVQYDAAVQEDSGGSPVIEVDANTGTQSIRVRVTGITAEIWNWKTSLRVVRLIDTP